MVIIDYCGHSFFVQQDNDQKKYLIHEFFFFKKRLHFLTWGMTTKGNTREEKEKRRNVISGYLCNILN